MSRFDLPSDLPRPVNDGACAHLTDFRVPSVELRATSEGSVDLSQLPGRTIVFCYPRTGRPNEPVPAAWDAIPSGRGSDIRSKYAGYRLPKRGGATTPSFLLAAIG